MRNHWPWSAWQKRDAFCPLCSLQVSCSPSPPPSTSPLSGVPAARWQLLHLCISQTDSSRTCVIFSVSLRGSSEQTLDFHSKHCWAYITGRWRQRETWREGDTGAVWARCVTLSLSKVALFLTVCHGYWFLALRFLQDQPLFFCFPVFFGPKNTSERFRMEDVLTIDPSSRRALRLLQNCSKLFATRHIYLFIFLSISLKLAKRDTVSRTLHFCLLFFFSDNF